MTDNTEVDSIKPMSLDDARLLINIMFRRIVVLEVQVISLRDRTNSLSKFLNRYFGDEFSQFVLDEIDELEGLK